MTIKYDENLFKKGSIDEHRYNAHPENASLAKINLNLSPTFHSLWLSSLYIII